MRTRVATGVVIGILALAGCGGGGTTYSGRAFRACLESDGASTISLRDAGRYIQGVSTADLVANLPNGFVADWRGDVALFSTAKDKHQAETSKAWAEQLAGRMTFTWKVTREGNLVGITGDHPTAGLLKLISQCRSDAVEK
jgi:hypothetical protein